MHAVAIFICVARVIRRIGRRYLIVGSAIGRKEGRKARREERRGVTVNDGIRDKREIRKSRNNEDS